ncbi:MAG: hypothetical protein AAF909_04345 [Pseudomonadota bacterium]
MLFTAFALALAFPPAPAAALDRKAAQGFIDVFADITTEDGLRFEKAPGRLLEAGLIFSQDLDTSLDLGVRASFEDASGEARATIWFSEVTPSMVMTMLLDDPASLRAFIEDTLSRRLGAPINLVERPSEAPAFGTDSATAVVHKATAAIAGRDVVFKTVEFTGDNGAQVISLVATTKIRPEGAVTPPFDRIPSRKGGVNRLEATSLIEGFVTSVAEVDPQLTNMRARLARTGWLRVSEHVFRYGDAPVEIDFANRYQDGSFVTLRFNISEETAILEPLRAAWRKTGAPPVQGSGLTEWEEELTSRIGDRDVIISVAPGLLPQDASVTISVLVLPAR